MHRGILPDTNGKNDEEPDLLTPRPCGTRDHVFSQLIFSVTRNFTRRMRHDQDGAFDAWQWCANLVIVVTVVGKNYLCRISGIHAPTGATSLKLDVH